MILGELEAKTKINGVYLSQCKKGQLYPATQGKLLLYHPLGSYPY